MKVSKRLSYLAGSFIALFFCISDIAAQNVGIGTDNPAKKLHILGSDTLGSLLIAPNEPTFNGKSELILAEDENGAYNMSVRYDGTDNRLKVFGEIPGATYGPHMTIERDNGYVGIGVLAPTQKLDVNGHINSSASVICDGDFIANSSTPFVTLDASGTSGTAGVQIQEQGNSISWMYWDVSNNFLTINADNSGGTRRDLVVTSAGNVGMGLSTPAEKLEVDGNISSLGNVYCDGDFYANSSSPFLFVDATGTTGTAGMGIREQGNSKGWIYYDVGGDFLTLNTDPGDGTRRDLVISSAGDIGIGLSDPSEKLHLSGGDMKITESNPWIYFDATSTGTNSGITFSNTASDGGGIFYSNYSQQLWLYASPSGSANPDIVITSAGNVGIGTSSPGYKFEVSADIKSGGDLVTAATDGVINVGGALDINSNVIGDTQTPDIFVANGDEDLYIEDDLELGSQGYKPGGGSWATVSDARLKKDIKPYTDGLDQLMQIEPVSFSYNASFKKGWDNGEEYVGIIAQDIREIAPYMVEEKALGRVVSENDDGSETVLSPGEPYLTFDGSALTYMLINSVKEQQEIIEAQQQQIDELMRRIEKLENK
jgi:hypothetical protein